MKSITVLILIIVIFLNTSIVKSQSIQELYENGKKAFYLDSFEDANKYFSQILSMPSDDYETCFYKAKVYEINFDNDKAIQEMTKAIEFKPKSSEAYFERATIYDKQQKTAEAVQDYTQAISKNKKYTEAYFNRASDMQEMKLYDNAIKDYTQVVKLNPDDDIAYYNRGLIYTELKEYDKAIEDFEKAISIDKVWEKELKAKIQELQQSK